MTSDVVVWCYLARKVLWFAFEPSVSNFIEKSHNEFNSSNKKRKRLLDIGFGSVSSFKSSEIDLKSQVLRDKYSGKNNEIKRIVCPPDSVSAKKVVWEFEGDSVDHWVAFDLDTTQLIEDACTRKEKKLDLWIIKGLPYIINLNSKIQKNVKTQKKRKIRRSLQKEPYTSDNFTSSVGASNLHGKRKNSADDSTSAKSSGIEGASCQSDRPCRRVSLPSCTYVEIPRLGSSSTKNATDPFYEFTKEVTTDDFQDDEDCCICFDNLGEESGFGEGMPESRDVVTLLKCQHLFHKLCLMEMYKKSEKDSFLQCPSCKCLHGDKMGDCPAGRMEWDVLDDLSLSGYEDCDTIQVTYKIRPGIQVQGQPNPGKPFTARGFPRTGFLPDSNKGRKVLKLLMEAFRRRLMFTVGSSTTTGETDTVTWNDIHHKTDVDNRRRGHGYPDPNYLDNVLLELAAHGVSEDCLEGDC